MVHSDVSARGKVRGPGRSLSTQDLTRRCLPAWLISHICQSPSFIYSIRTSSQQKEKIKCTDPANLIRNVLRIRPYPVVFCEVGNARLRRNTSRQQCRAAFCFLRHPLRSIRLAGNVSTVRKQVRKGQSDGSSFFFDCIFVAFTTSSNNA